jgi:hypothetical protein
MATTLHIAKANANFQLPEGHTGAQWARMPAGGAHPAGCGMAPRNVSATHVTPPVLVQGWVGTLGAQGEDR